MDWLSILGAIIGAGVGLGAVIAGCGYFIGQWKSGSTKGQLDYLALADEKEKRLQAEIQALREESKRQQAQLSQMQQEIASLRGNLDAVSTERDKLQTQVSNMLTPAMQQFVTGVAERNYEKADMIERKVDMLAAQGEHLAKSLDEFLLEMRHFLGDRRQKVRPRKAGG